jgi:hypothetical protein
MLVKQNVNQVKMRGWFAVRNRCSLRSQLRQQLTLLGILAEELLSCRYNHEGPDS